MSEPKRLEDIHMEESSRAGSMVNLTGSSPESGSRLILLLIAVIGLVSLVSIIVSAVSLSRPSVPNVTVNNGQSKGSSDQGTPITINSGITSGTSPGKKVWTIAVGHEWGAYEYIDPKGYLQGFSFDLIRAVCQAAGIDCRLVWDQYTNCWNSKAGSHPFGGPGLHGRWYDACNSWVPTINRIHVFSFSQPYLKSTPTYFYVKQSSSFDPTNVNGKKIGFIDGWSSDEKCLARNTAVTGSYPMPKGNIIHYPGPEALKKAIVAGEVDAGYQTNDAMGTYVKNNLLKRVGAAFACSLSGNSMMTRKDSEFIGLWNRGFNKLRGGGKFAQLCEQGKKTHTTGNRGVVQCVEN